MKVKHAVILLVLGYCLDFVGSLFKMMHHAQADSLLITATCLKVFGGLLFLFKVLTYPKIKDFINW